MAVEISAHLSDELELGTPRFLFEVNVTYGNFAVMPDGESLVTVGYDDAVVPDHLVLVQNWTEELKRLVPTDN